MPDGQVLEFTNVTKRFNEVTAVSDLSARVEPGAVTAFLGPNGAGKTTTLRILLGQIRATSGTATIGGTAFAELRQPLRTIGSVLEETAYRPRRTASRQLTIAAKANGIALSRVDDVLAEVGLEGEGDSRIGGFSLGMRQRLSVAHALLGDPGALVFDEPANGLDPEGIRWMRLLMRRLADEGRTVLVSSHVLSEVEQVADNVLVLSKGQLVLSSGIETLADPAAGSVVVDAADRAALTTALSTAGFDVEVLRSGLTVRGGDASTVGAVAAQAGIALSTLVQRGPTLEDVFIDLVRGGKLEARASAAASQLTPARSGLPIAAAPVAVADAAADEALVAETSAVSAAVSGGAPADPVAAAGIAASAEGEADAAPADDAAPIEAEAEADIPTGDEDAAAEEATPADEASSDPTADTDESDADESDADEPVTDEPVADDSDAEASSDEAVEAPASPSFDEILFGTAAPVAAGSTQGEGDEPVHDVGQIFADQHDHDGNDAERHDGEQNNGEQHDGEREDAGDADADTEHTEGDGAEASGIEIFDDLGGAASETDDDASDEDPRSAAVSTMLAAAARAYYEDEPRDYPLGEQTADESTTWSVASTGVIDTVPQAASEDTANEGASEEQGPEANGSEDSSGEHHEGEHHEHHEGDEHHHNG
ncbi:ATP-binding cassette domain-containing protein [Microbacterium oxydans]|uniref:Putative ABC transporter ATP-binding protein YxlF n=1 Tax=Microbacterium oxydans TaxID=82380 RepID=A0A0F0LDK7_9MICO|nr:ATP-binding cassette domain-containing protein [Microbacterium oxydans]KJL30365.1 putative ABC transporter ATP-binding protein YxlF [Microbacterium oxydans]